MGAHLGDSVPVCAQGPCGAPGEPGQKGQRGYTVSEALGTLWKDQGALRAALAPSATLPLLDSPWLGEGGYGRAGDALGMVCLVWR